MQFKQGDAFDFGTISFSEEEIVSFAKLYDPLDFHINKEAAERSIFKGFIASGPHAFHYYYISKWIPLFGKTVMAGLGINDWKFLKPIYPNQQIHCTATIIGTEEYPEKKSVAVNWKFEFKNDSGDLPATAQGNQQWQAGLFQHLSMKVLHRTEP